MAESLVFFCFGLVILAIFIEREVLSPSFLLSASFFIASINLFLNRKNWLFYSNETVKLIFWSILSFELGCIIVKMFYHRKDNSDASVQDLMIQREKLYLYFAFQFIFYMAIVIFLFRTTGIKASLTNLSQGVGGYYNGVQSGTISGLPSILNIVQILNVSGVYYLIYTLICIKQNDKKIPMVLYLNILIGVFGSLLTGTKTTFFMYLIAFVVIYIFLKGKNYSRIKKIDVKSIVEMILAVFLLLISFKFLTNLQGREISNVNFIDTLSTYLGAPIKNLEIIVNAKPNVFESFGAQTFSNTYDWLYGITGKINFHVTNMYQYNWIFGKGLGNVYTILMPLYVDFGYFGSFFVMFILGIFCQYIYNNAKFKRPRNKVNFRIIFYSYLSFAIIFSFFSNKMFEMIFSRSGIYFIIGLYFFDFFFRKLYFKKRSLENNNVIS